MTYVDHNTDLAAHRRALFVRRPRREGASTMRTICMHTVEANDSPELVSPTAGWTEW
jgi:hypothetical protein